MSEEPETKRSKVDGDTKEEESRIEQLHKNVQEKITSLGNVQLELNTINDKASAEIIQIEQKYNELRKPFFEKRQTFIEGIPNFWLTVFISHPATRAALNEDEEECFHYCTKFEVIEESTDNKNNTSLKFTFDVNPFFENTELVKKFIIPIAGEQESTCTSTKIDWKPGKKLLNDESAQDLGTRSFFEWFLDNTDPSGDELADIIKDDIWLNPLQYYLMQDEDSSFVDSGSDAELNSDDEEDEDPEDLNE